MTFRCEDCDTDWPESGADLFFAHIGHGQVEVEGDVTVGRHQVEP